MVGAGVSAGAGPAGGAAVYKCSTATFLRCTSPLPSRGPTLEHRCYVTHVFSEVPIKRDKIKSGYLNPAFSGAHMRVEVLRSPCVLGGPHKRGQNQKWLPHPCLLRGRH